MKGKCLDISELLGVSEDEALILNDHFSWRKDLIESQWFDNEESVRKRAGLTPQTVLDDTLDSQISCALCMESCPRDKCSSLDCKHYLCEDCWAEYIQFNVSIRRLTTVSPNLI